MSILHTNGAGQEHEVHYFGADLARCDGVVILLHGRRQLPEDMRQLAERFALSGIAYIVPVAPELTWYPRSFLRDVEDNEPHLRSAFERIDALIRTLLERGFDERRIFLMGFSQGACIASQYLWERPRRIGGLISLTGGLFGPGPLPEAAGGGQQHALKGVKILMTGSETDSWVPANRVRESARMFEARGAVVTSLMYGEREHLVLNDEIEQARALLRA